MDLSSVCTSPCLDYRTWEAWWEETVFDGVMMHYFLVAEHPVFLSSQPLGGSLWVVQDLSVP